MKTTMKYDLTPLQMAIIKKSTDNKCWRRLGEKGTLLHCWWEYKLIQPLWKMVWRFIKKIRIKPPYDSAIPLLGIYPKETKIEKDIYILYSLQHCLPEKAMAPHSSTLAWKIPWMEDPGRMQSMVFLRVGHDWATSLSLFTFIHWRRKWQPTPVFLLGESQGRRSLVGCHLWGRTELDTIEAT